MEVEFPCEIATHGSVSLMEFRYPWLFRLSPVHTSCKCKCNTNFDITNSQLVLNSCETFAAEIALHIHIRRKYEPGLRHITEVGYPLYSF